MADAAVLGPVGGLTAHEAQRRLLHDGPNRLPAPPRPSAVRRFIAQLTHFFAAMLWAAGALAFLGGLPQLGIAIFGVVILNALFAFVQEGKAGQAAERLRDLLPRRVAVRRDGLPIDIRADEVVVGDLLLLEAGDRIPADARITVARDLLVDTSMLTGESDATFMEDGSLFGGTFVVAGEAEAVVTAVGVDTQLARIAALTVMSASPASPLARELQRVVRTIAVIAVGIGGSFFTLSVLLGNEMSEGFVFAIGVTVALVPEALLPTVTLSLAWGAEQMARRNVLVRQLEAVETLGSTTFICTDKTGTLTRNEMTVVEAWTPRGSATVTTPGYAPVADVRLSSAAAADAIRRLALSGARCATGFVQQDGTAWRPHGDPMEAALDAFARRLGVDTPADRLDHPQVSRFPFDPTRRRMSVVVDGEVLAKGASETVLPLCATSEAARLAARTMTERGLRVLAVAGRRVSGDPPASASEAESGLELLGLFGMEDPPRSDVRQAVDQCRVAGIKVAMITGDHPATAAAIAAEVGLADGSSAVLTGDQLPIDDEEALGRLLDHDGLVVARVSPEQKLFIARALRARGHVVAMTGDGVNDGPALHEADIGIAMGASGTDVAREAADLVLLDDHFASIVAGIEQGRTTFVNTRRFLTYHLTDNVAELTPFVLWALSGGRFPLALGVLQILALDLGTDTLSATALGAEGPSPHLLEGPPVSGRLLNRTVVRRAFGVLGPLEAVLSITAFVASFVSAGWRPGEPFPGGDVLATASGGAFLTVVIAQAANALACRSSSRSPRALGWSRNRLLLAAITAGVTISLLAIFLPPIAHQLGHAAPSLAGWAIALASAPILLVVDAADKARRRRPGRSALSPAPNASFAQKNRERRLR